jgi:serine/threonine protein kinase
VHNDIKLDNLLVGFKDPSILYLIDFGLTTKYLNENGTHIEK